MPESARAREAAETEQAAAPQRAPADRHAELLRVASAVGNRRLAQMLQREGYGYGYADDPLNAGGFGPSDATVRVRPGPVRATIIGEPATYGPAPTAAAAAAEPAPAPAAVPEEPLTPVRQMIFAEINKWAGAVEGAAGDPRFSQIISAGALESARIEAASDVHLSGPKKGEAKTPSKHTTCIDFQTVIWSRVRDQMTKAGHGTMKRIVTAMNAPTLGDAWVKAEPGMPATRRPKKGDFFVLWSTKPTAGGGVQPKSFSHVAYFTGRSDNGDGTETWTSVDGGQGSAAEYTPKGKLISKGAEAILACTRVYDPATNLVGGGVANQAAGARWLYGWVDVDKLVT